MFLGYMRWSSSHGRLYENVVYIVKHQAMDATETGYEAEDARVTAVRSICQAQSLQLLKAELDLESDRLELLPYISTLRRLWL